MECINATNLRRKSGQMGHPESVFGTPFPEQLFLKFDIFGSFLGLTAQRGWTKGFFIEKPTPKSGTEANRGTATGGSCETYL